MIKFYMSNNELDIDKAFNQETLDQIESLSTINFKWSGITKVQNAINLIINRWSFFIKEGSILCLEKQEIKEFTFYNGSYNLKTYSQNFILTSNIKGTPIWNLNNYFILKYHLFQEFINILRNSDTLVLDSLSEENLIDKIFLMDFIYSFINKNYLLIYTQENKTLIKVEIDLSRTIEKLEELINEMEDNLTLFNKELQISYNII